LHDAFAILDTSPAGLEGDDIIPTISPTSFFRSSGLLTATFEICLPACTISAAKKYGHGNPLPKGIADVRRTRRKGSHV
ncbi:hypothetical protein RY831_00335, partial [Noviherbaspirillum sp. CPCC 100848]